MAKVFEMRKGCVEVFSTMGFHFELSTLSVTSDLIRTWHCFRECLQIERGARRHLNKSRTGEPCLCCLNELSWSEHRDAKERAIKRDAMELWLGNHSHNHRNSAFSKSPWLHDADAKRHAPSHYDLVVPDAIRTSFGTWSTFVRSTVSVSPAISAHPPPTIWSLGRSYVLNSRRKLSRRTRNNGRQHRPYIWSRMSFTEAKVIWNNIMKVPLMNLKMRTLDSGCTASRSRKGVETLNCSLLPDCMSIIVTTIIRRSRTISRFSHISKQVCYKREIVEVLRTTQDFSTSTKHGSPIFLRIGNHLVLKRTCRISQR